MNTTTIDTRQSDTIYPQLSSNNMSDNNNSTNNMNNNSSEDDGEWVVKAPVKRQPRRQASLQNDNNNGNENKGWNSFIEGEYEDDYMSYTEHELSKHVKATQLKNIRTHPGVPLAVRRKH
ncbi:hypothetical protein BGX24_009070 [Mortierella sp. AD032]|nr:hypothetical protein BGX24_009070 [Mortierella sp. AD032]